LRNVKYQAIILTDTQAKLDTFCQKCINTFRLEDKLSNFGGKDHYWHIAPTTQNKSSLGNFKV
jgi:hypothetical protein